MDETEQAGLGRLANRPEVEVGALIALGKVLPKELAVAALQALQERYMVVPRPLTKERALQLQPGARLIYLGAVSAGYYGSGIGTFEYFDDDLYQCVHVELDDTVERHSYNDEQRRLEPIRTRLGLAAHYTQFGEL